MSALVTPREPVDVERLTAVRLAEMLDWATGYLAEHPDWEMAGIGNNNQAWARDVLTLAAALIEARGELDAIVTFARHPYTCDRCIPSPEWQTHREYAEHMALVHGRPALAAASREARP